MFELNQRLDIVQLKISEKKKTNLISCQNKDSLSRIEIVNQLHTRQFKLYFDRRVYSSCKIKNYHLL